MKKLLATLMRIMFIFMLVFVIIPSFILLLLNYVKSRMR